MGEIEEVDVEMGTQDDGSLEGVNQLKSLLHNMESKLNCVDPPVASKSCIYRVPQSLRKLNEEAYTPYVVSIGPFHYRDEKLESMEKLKLAYLKSFLQRTKVSLQVLLCVIKDSEEIIRQCYAETIELKSQDFVQMILVDACFIIENFHRNDNSEQWLQDDPILSKPWLNEDILRDLTLLENQLPFFILEKLFSVADPSHKYNSVPSLSELAIYYFLDYNRQKIKPAMDFLHFTDLLRTIFIPRPEGLAKRESSEIKLLYSASKLVEASVKFKTRESRWVFELQFSKRVLEMQQFEISDRTECHIRNLLAYEQCHFPYMTYITDYIIFLDCLIDTEKDANILVEKGIIINFLGDNNVIAALVNKLGINLSVMNYSSKFLGVINELNEFYENPWNKWMANLRHDYCSTPWKIASFIVAFVLLLLTLIQTVCSILSLL